MKLRKLFKLDIIRSVSVLATGTILAQLIPIAIQPILRRLYSPEVFGNYAVYISLVGILVIFASFRYEVAIVLPKKNSDSANLLFLSIIINLFTSLLILISIILFKKSIAGFLQIDEDYINWLYFVPLSVFLFSTYRPMNYWLIRSKAFRYSSSNKIVRRATESTVHMIGGILVAPFAMVLGEISGNIMNILVGVRQLRRTKLTLKYFSKKRIKHLALKYKEYPIYNLFPALFNTAATLIPVLFIKKVFTPEITGFYDLTKTVLSVPMAFLSISVSQALFQKLSEHKNRNLRLTDQITPIIRILTIVAVAFIAILFFWSEELFSLVFGKEWLVSGSYARILAYSFAFKFIVSPISISLLALERVKIWSAWQVFYLVSIGIMLSFPYNDIFAFLRIYMIVDLFAYSVYAFIIAREVIKYDKKII